jgi:2-amino-4-hydroxy-6-hydroxymethyldihydropteridine diphosphokinase
VNTAYLLIGGNLGEKLAKLQNAIALLSKTGILVSTSSIYETEAWGLEDQPSFLNQAVVLQTKLEPQQLMTQLLFIEQQLGRVREQKFGPRLIDIDILLMDDIVLQTEDLTIPHPSLHLRNFALTPLAEIAGNKLHPVFNKTITELLNECPDKLDVKKI